MVVCEHNIHGVPLPEHEIQGFHQVKKCGVDIQSLMASAELITRVRGRRVQRQSPGQWQVSFRMPDLIEAANSTH